uniref:Uncharacterized protein n=1 Tax=Oxyrrhis marina TaxID=2969 RepID=A0A7S3UL65_OXYMA
MTGCSGESSSGCSLPDKTVYAQCKTEDQSKISDGDCFTAGGVVACVKGCGVPAGQSCVQDCYAKQCPDVSANCLTCYSNFYSCSECAVTKKEDPVSVCSDPYKMCVNADGCIPEWSGDAQCSSQDYTNVISSGCTTSERAANDF